MRFASSTIAQRFAVWSLILLLPSAIGAGGEPPGVPFKGTVTAAFTIEPSGDPEVLIVNYVGTGQATHLGRFTVTAQYELEAEDLIEFLTEPYVVEGVGFTFEAANGDTLTGTYTGYTSPAGDGFVHFLADATITGGQAASRV